MTHLKQLLPDGFYPSCELLSAGGAPEHKASTQNTFAATVSKPVNGKASRLSSSRYLALLIAERPNSSNRFLSALSYNPNLSRR
ncbi:hypothetical protein ACJJIR_08300 [Microbulbifer sp. SSSA008]|uniref:hypothetical protein n=1 Tax=Microbulbifer sp. SSSA008 TaxID=3243380 RepID=UPI00403A75A3